MELFILKLAGWIGNAPVQAQDNRPLSERSEGSLALPEWVCLKVCQLLGLKC
jgi:hypothetical protein